MVIYGLTGEEIDKAKEMYAKEVRELLDFEPLKAVPKAKEVIKRKDAFFEKETQENKEWLSKHGFIIELPEEAVQKINKKIDQTQNFFKDFIGEFSSLMLTNFEQLNLLKKARVKYLEEKIKSYIRGGASLEEAKRGASDDWEELSDEEKNEWIQKLN